MIESPGAKMIADERLRQRYEEGWTDEHDDSHDGGELIGAAVVYALCAEMPPGPPSDLWPWECSDFKPSEEPITNLVKAGALLAAEIDRKLRLKSRADEPA